MTRRDVQGALIHDIGVLLWVDTDAVFRPKNDELNFRLHGPLVCQRGKVELGADHPIAVTVPDGLGHCGEGCRGRWKERELVGCGTQEEGYPSAQVLDPTEPVPIPGRRAHLMPVLGKLAEVGFRTTGEGPERARVHVGLSLENGEL